MYANLNGQLKNADSNGKNDESLCSTILVLELKYARPDKSFQTGHVQMKNNLQM